MNQPSSTGIEVCGIEMLRRWSLAAEEEALLFVASLMVDKLQGHV